MKFVNGVGFPDATSAREASALFIAAGITSPEALRAWVTTGAMPAGSRLASDAFQRGLLMLLSGVRFRQGDTTLPDLSLDGADWRVITEPDA